MPGLQSFMTKSIQEGPLQEVQELHSRKTFTGNPRTAFNKDHHRKSKNCIQGRPSQETQELNSRKTFTGNPRTAFKEDLHRKPKNCIQGRPSQETQELHSVIKLLNSTPESIQQVKIQDLGQFPISLDCDWLLLLLVARVYLIVIGYCCCWLLGDT